MPNRRIAALLLASTALFAASCGGSDDDSTAATTQTTAATTATPPADAANAGSDANTVVIAMKGIKFVPDVQTVKLGQTVKWVNEDTVPHDADAKDGKTFTSDLFTNGKSFSYKPTKVGEIAYLCSIHPGMVATLDVVK